MCKDRCAQQQRMLLLSDVFIPMPPGQRTHSRRGVGRGRRRLSMACIVVAVLGMIANVTSGPSPASSVPGGVPGPGSGSPEPSTGQLGERLRGGKNRSRQAADCSAPCVGSHQGTREGFAPDRGRNGNASLGDCGVLQRVVTTPHSEGDPEKRV